MKKIFTKAFWDLRWFCEPIACNRWNCKYMYCQKFIAWKDRNVKITEDEKKKIEERAKIFSSHFQQHTNKITNWQWTIKNKANTRAFNTWWNSGKIRAKVSKLWNVSHTVIRDRITIYNCQQNGLYIAWVYSHWCVYANWRNKKCMRALWDADKSGCDTCRKAHIDANKRGIIGCHVKRLTETTNRL